MSYADVIRYKMATLDIKTCNMEQTIRTIGNKGNKS